MFKNLFSCLLLDKVHGGWSDIGAEETMALIIRICHEPFVILIFPCGLWLLIGVQLEQVLGMVGIVVVVVVGSADVTFRAVAVAVEAVVIFDANGRVIGSLAPVEGKIAPRLGCLDTGQVEKDQAEMNKSMVSCMDDAYTIASSLCGDTSRTDGEARRASS